MALERRFSMEAKTDIICSLLVKKKGQFEIVGRD
jgi:hypothetical protein